MILFRSSRGIRRRLKGSVLAIGNFDGVHRAHQEILKRVRGLARERGGPAALYTFEPHPAKVLAPHLAPPLITTPAQKMECLKKARLDAVVVEPFDHRFAQLTPEIFFKRILLGRIGPKAVVVGYDFTFGSKRAGNSRTLAVLGRRHGVAVHIISPILLKEGLVSSSQVRRAVQDGSVSAACSLLGRPFQLVGRVVRGGGVGKILGFHTANLQVENELIPADGVYATRTLIGRRRYPSVTNIGFKPTVGSPERTVETHVPGLKRNLYGRRIAVDFLTRLRNEKKFASLQRLKERIARDIRRAARIKT